ncbi:methyltransferase domain-containing protein [bacterium]|nr:methyltransferase domain-containing protein [bacterium]
MDSNDRIRVHDEDASQYDEQVRKYEYHGHEALFGMCFDLIKPGQSLLDLGIGTGLSSELFQRHGLRISGMDGSETMLTACRAKNLAEELIQTDLSHFPWPVADHTYSIVISSGLFHFFGDLQPVFSEVKRLLRRGGIFAFTVAVPESDKPTTDRAGIDPVEMPTAWGVPIFLHPYGHVLELLEQMGFELLKRQRLLVIGGPGEHEDIRYGVYVARLRG